MFVKGVTSQDIANELGVSSQSVSHWINSRRHIPEAIAEQLSAMFGIPVLYLEKDLDGAGRIEVEGIISDDTVQHAYNNLLIRYTNMMNNYKKLSTMQQKNTEVINKMKEDIIDYIKKR